MITYVLVLQFSLNKGNQNPIPCQTSINRIETTKIKYTISSMILLLIKVVYRGCNNSLTIIPLSIHNNHLDKAIHFMKQIQKYFKEAMGQFNIAILLCI